MKRLAGFVLALLCGSAASAAELYKWTDEQGKVHYTDQPPPEGVAAEKREVKTPPPAPPPPADAAKKAGATPGNATSSSACLTAKRNLAVFEQSTTVQMDLDGDGAAETLDATQRQRELQRTQDLIKTLCNS